MKSTLKSLLRFFVITAVAILITPTLSMGSTINFITNDISESRSITGPDPPFTPDWTDPAGSLVSGLISLFGINLNGDIYGPGISTWDNGSTFYDGGLTVESKASAVGTFETDVDFWNYTKTQNVSHTVGFGASYVLNGTLGTSSNIMLDYEFDYTLFNLAIDGRSKSGASADIGYFVLPASIAANYTVNPYDFILENPLYFSSHIDISSFDYSKSYKFIGGFKETTGQQSGQIDYGTMGVGDRLYLYGKLNAYTECQNYLAGLTVATMFPSFTTSLSANEIPVSPVPEPSTFLLLGGGLAGLAFYARRRRK